MRHLRKTLVLSLTLLGLMAFLMVSASAQTDKKAGAKKSAQMGAKKEASLYTRLGGKKAIELVVADFVNNCATDSRINAFFKQTAADPKRLAKFKQNLVDQICEAAQGPC